MAALLGEMRPALLGARIDKIHQPERDLFIFALRTGGGNRKLLISAGTSDARMHFTQSEFENPSSPPMLCMLLRKHLLGAVITAVEQPPRERAAIITLSGTDAFGGTSEKTLVAELMGRGSNLILADAGGIIIDCLRRVDHEQSEKRQVLRGLRYELPPKSENSTGYSPLIAREIELRGEAVLRAPPSPVLLADEDGAPADFTFCDITQYGDRRRCVAAESFSALLDGYFGERSRAARLAAKASNLLRAVTKLKSRAERKIEAQLLEIESAKDRETLRESADILMANLAAVAPGAQSVTLPDFYTDGEREIGLDPRRNAQQNAAKLYKDYQKAKNAEKVLAEQIKAAELEAAYLGSVASELRLAESEREIDEIRRELVSSGYVKDAKQKEKVKPSAPRRFSAPSGAEVLVGRNNTQNDALTFKTAKRGELWFHAQKIHGSHVILRAESASGADVEFAAALAARYSEGRDEAQVAVDYTAVKNVKKIPGAKPGMVRYYEFKSVRADPKQAGAGTV
jgi:predicted ribosome quality control (RQC) complex YloA/Tae2 family protein